ncbi:MAG: endonuclease/exonuclease/phosphatase family protein [Spirochaetales bacterium]|nr:endonuclease/exonuclease/phosphatase family protein [Spirochaetales bacterium]MCF7939167.1 endonuclease/exonuclease/phosphatase family protein [Spirochaetales bacterium]
MKNKTNSSVQPPSFLSLAGGAGGIIIFIGLLISCSGCTFSLFGFSAKEPAEWPRQIRVMSWNVQNLFDATDDGSEYPEFDPSSESWNEDIYQERLDRVGEGIILAGRWSSGMVDKENPGCPEILLLQEIENEGVLADMVAGPLSGCGYRHAATAGGEGAVTVGVLSRFPIEKTRSFSIQYYSGTGSSEEGRSKLRPVLEIWFETNKGRELVLFNNHWKSKSGGAAATEPLRIRSAALVSKRITGILAKTPEVEFLVAGDLNENIDEYNRINGTYPTALLPPEQAETAPGSLLVTKDEDQTGRVGRPVLFSTWAWMEKGGSYWYSDNWETIDHFLLGQKLIDNSGLEAVSAAVVDPVEFLDESGRPKGWYGPGSNGYSDHLPIMLVIEQ